MVQKANDKKHKTNIHTNTEKCISNIIHHNDTLFK